MERKPFTDLKIDALLGAMAEAETSTSTRHSFYPTHLAPTGTGIDVRLFTTDDDLPWAEQNIFRLPMGGIVNSDNDTTNDVVVTCQCMNTWGRPDRVLLAEKPNWKYEKGSPQREQAATYYFKRSYIYQGFVVSSPIVQQNEPANPIVPFKFGKQLHDTLTGGLRGGGMDWSPFGDTHGRNFVIKKTLQGAYNNYSTSAWSFKETPWSDAIREAVATYGLWDLSQIVGVEPNGDVQDMIWELYQASLRGDPFDAAVYGSHFRAFEKFGNGITNGGGQAAAPLPVPVKAEADDEILKQLRAKNTGRRRVSAADRISE